jgi:hypothetical protein
VTTRELRFAAAVAAALLVCAATGAQQRKEYPDPNAAGRGNPLIRDGDNWFARRQEKRVGSVADRAAITAAVRSYETATEAADSIEARWKLARALLFRGAYTDLDPAARLAAFDRARRAGDDAVLLLDRRSRRAGHPEFAALSPAEVAEAMRKDLDAPPSFYWAAAAWGQWALARGKEEAVRLGAADKVRRYAEILIALDPKFEDGGGYRLLGRLHDQAPVMAQNADWVSRAEAVRNLRLAVGSDPANFANRLFLAEALARGTAAERAEAVALAERLVSESPSPARLIEDLRTQEDAARDLAAWKGSGERR